ncbi:DNA alkylation repair protein [Bacillus alkalicellulosilyticus]|uniref:DNA alkylation repair protein n=1 Tax=Alkalihalobacterium alkalicellulosilyticum TaxID=1912214 RepID=UPI000998A8ED|nr:DNA alkylation repair protein [Bacillus alkalicellulosilyticus]
MAELLKDKYNKTFFSEFIAIVKSAYPSFDEQKFLKHVYTDDWELLELKQRMRQVTKAVQKTFPSSYEEAIHLLEDIAPKCRGLEYLFFPDFVEVYGLEQWESSMKALSIFTEFSTSEFAIRPFIMRDQEKAFEQLRKWSVDENEHRRRLASEGCRPRLPWGVALQSLKKDPTPILPILQTLKEDNSLYVRKSVANNVNDISKDHPGLVKQIIRDWGGKHPNTDWILKHGSRTLLKKGDKEALRLFGFTDVTEVDVENVTLSHEQLSIGQSLQFSFDLHLRTTQSLRVEYVIDYVKANGKHSSKKFHLSEKEYKSGKVTMTKKHAFKDLSTRKHYSGQHKLTIVINGEEKASEFFILLASSLQ